MEITTGYQIVSVDISGNNGNCTIADDGSGGTLFSAASVTLDAPTGTKVVGGGFTGLAPSDQYNQPVVVTGNGPSADGTSWIFTSGAYTLDYFSLFLPFAGAASYVFGTVYAICMAV